MLTVWAILKTVTISLYNNINEQIDFAVNPQKKEVLSRSLSSEKKLRIIEERLATVERLTYAIHKDPLYIKSDKGHNDIKELKRKVND